MTTIRAHFDGRFLVPEEPLHLPVGPVFEFQLQETPETLDALQESSDDWIGEENGIPMVIIPPGTKKMTSEDFRRADDEY